MAIVERGAMACGISRYLKAGSSAFLSPDSVGEYLPTK